MRLATKIWLALGAVTLAVLAGWSFYFAHYQADHRIEEARAFNRQIYDGVQLTIDIFGAAFQEGRLGVFTPEDVDRFLSGGQTNIMLVEVYGADGARLFSTVDNPPPPESNVEAFGAALQGTKTSNAWIGRGGLEGTRSQDLSFWRLLRGGEFADEYWGPLSGPQGEPIGVVRVLISLPGLHRDVLGILGRTAALSAGLAVAMWLALWLMLNVVLQRPLRQLIDVTGRIRTGETSARAATAGGDELAELGRSFNAMADELEFQATTDSLTDLINHRYLNRMLEGEVEKAKQEGLQVSIMLGDIDGFKLFNDTYGHAAGDDVLRLVAGVLAKGCRVRGFASRYGGDEFLLVLPETDKQRAADIARELGALLGETHFTAPDGSRIPIRLSWGIASFPDDADSKDRLLALADTAMYQAKRLGADAAEAGSIEVVASSGDGTDTLFGTLDSLVQAIHHRDQYTKTHSDVVASYAAQLGAEAGLSEESLRALRVAGILHDVGKLIVPDEVLKKPGPLTDEEREVVRKHPLVGETLIKQAPFLEDVIQAVGCHHERYDGAGYPRGLKGDDIPFLARVMAIADAYSAMSLNRPYRKALSGGEIIAQLRGGAAKQFDPQLVELFISRVLGEPEQKAA